MATIGTAAVLAPSPEGGELCGQGDYWYALGGSMPERVVSRRDGR